MLSRSTVRLLALLILLFSGVEMFACDELSHDGYKQATDVASLGHHSRSQNSSETCGCDDGCLCCCTHVIPTPAFTLASLGPLVLLTPELPQASPESVHTAVYHPPRA